MVAYTEYEFCSGTTSLLATDTTSTVFTVASQGVNFTWSISDPAGNNTIGHFPATTVTTDGALTASVCGISGSTPQDMIKLGLTDTKL